MRYSRTLAPALASLALIIVLAACGQATANPPSPIPSASGTPTPTATPSIEPTVSPAPTASSSVALSPTPAPGPIEVIEHELPMVARSTDDGVNVRTLPSLDAPLISGERFDLTTVPNVRLNAGDLVIARMGPVFADSESWYEVGAADGSEVYWEFGWVAGRYLVRESDVPSHSPIIVGVHGLGSGSSASTQVIVGTPATVRFAAAPMPDADACEIDVTLIRTDGLAVNVATESIDGPKVAQLSSNELSSLFQEEAGTITLEVETNCSYAATLTVPPS